MVVVLLRICHLFFIITMASQNKKLFQNHDQSGALSDP